MNEEKTKISVVIPTFNSESTIRDCLSSVLDQTLAPHHYEVIAVDSSTDRTPDIIREEFPRVRLIRAEKKMLPGPARNMGIGSAAAGLIMFIDSDCIAGKDILERMLDRHRQGEHAAIGGAILNGTPHSAIGWVDYLMSFSPFMPSMDERLVPQIPTCNACYKADVLRQHGFFPSYDFLAEDLILNWRVFRGGARLLFDPSVKVTHINRTSLSYLLRHQWTLGWSFALALRCTDMSGQIFVRYPALAAFLPVLRLGSLVSRVARRDLKVLVLSLLLSPLYLVGACAWASGFFRGATMGDGEYRVRLEAKP
ncbi:MAG: glycosyltransferase [Candidatus Eisenbacteria bacterium]